MEKNSTRNRIPLASTEWLKYLGIVFIVLCVYVVLQCYYHYSDDLFSRSLTPEQHIKLSIFSIGSMLSQIVYPLLFFSGALLYRSVRLRGINPLNALRHDLFVIIPLGLILWLYTAYSEEPISRNFYVMMIEIQQLEPGEKLIQDPEMYELCKAPNLSGLNNEIDTLDVRIKTIESKMQTQGQLGLESYIRELQKQRTRYKDEIRVIHFTPLYIILFFLFGMLLGYLIPLHKAALTAILIAISFSWYYGVSVLESQFGFGYSTMYGFLLGKIGLLLLLNTVLLIVATKQYKRSIENSERE